MQEVQNRGEITTQRPVRHLGEHGLVVERRFYAGEVEYVLVRCPCGGLCDQKIANDP